MQYIIVTKKRIIQANARSYTHLVNSLVEAGIEWLHIERLAETEVEA